MKGADKMKSEIKSFGKTSSGEEVFEYILENKMGARLALISYGAAIKSLCLKNGRDVVLGYDSIAGYESDDKYMGAIAGRCANRICGGRFALNGKEYKLAVNNGLNHLHGGIVGFDKKIWNGNINGNSVQFKLISPNMDEGYPGEVRVMVKYTFTENNEVEIEYSAISDQDTIINLTNHTYFNLNGGGTIENHIMTIYAQSFTEINESGCSSGVISPVERTPLDFRKPKRIGQDIDADYVQLKYASGYDHNFVLKGSYDRRVQKAAYVESGDTTLEVWTDQTGMHFYSGNFLDGAIKGKKGADYKRRYGFALETQDWPDAINHENFPNVIIKKGEEYRRKTIFKLTERV
ncbi:aldose 1-epimerase [Clostridiales bacterium]|nr:aldose 1-epimerase [Clostridiales bacterium]